MNTVTLPVDVTSFPQLAAIQQFFAQYWWLLLVVVLWTIVWKGLALWKAARNNHKAWFIILLIVNTVGILEIIYYFSAGKRQKISG